MNKLIKILACITAISLMSSYAPIVEAATLPGVNSNFEYELSIQRISNSDIQLTFFTTCNPGITELALAILFDNSKYFCTKVTNDINASNEGNLILRPGINNDEGIVFMGGVFNSYNTYGEEYSENFEIYINFRAVDGNVDDEELSTFSAAVPHYASYNQNVFYDQMPPSNIYDPEICPPQITEQITPSQSITYNYYVGDANGSESIELADATTIGSLANALQYTGTTPSINILNHKISNNETSVQSNGNTIYWRNMFSSLMRTVSGVSFPCVESADADNDGFITLNDSTTVLSWYSQIGASSVSPSDVLQLEHKTVYF